MTEAYLILVVVLALIAAASIFFKNKEGRVAPVIFIAGAVASLIAGLGLQLREIVEGPFAYLDNAMWVLCGMMLVSLLMDNGTFDYIFEKIVSKKRGAFVQVLLLLLFIGLPGMLTGTAVACVVTTGAMVGKYLMKKGVDKAKTVELVAVGSLFGMLMPPLCLPAMMIVVGRQGSYPASFEGYFVPLLVLALPALLVYCAMAGKRIVADISVSAASKKGSVLCLIPLVVTALLLISHNFLYFVMPFLGYPLIYVIGFILAIFLPAMKANPLTSALSGIRTVAPAVALLFACGSLSEVLTMVGTNGTLATAFVLTNQSLLTVAGILIVAVAGLLVGGSFAWSVGTVFAYLVGALVYPNGEIALVAVGAALAIGMFLAPRGGLIGQTSEVLGVEGVKNTQIITKAVVPMAIVLVIALVYAFAGSSALGFLMI